MRWAHYKKKSFGNFNKNNWYDVAVIPYTTGISFTLSDVHYMAKSIWMLVHNPLCRPSSKFCTNVGGIYLSRRSLYALQFPFTAAK